MGTTRITSEGPEQLLSTSVVISTYSRPQGVLDVLESLSRQTVMPKAIYVVDQSPGTAIAEAVERGRTLYPSLRGLTHLKVDFQGLTKARNHGLARVTTPVTTFIDDDVVVGPTYIEEVLAFFRGGHCVVVGGLPRFGNLEHRGGPPPSTAWALYRRLFNISRPGDTWRVLPNFEVLYNTAISEPIQSEYISGSNFSVLTAVAKDIGFDEKLIYYSIGEDIDFPVRVRRKHPHAVWLNPLLPVSHPLPPEEPWKDFILYVHSLHHYYLFYKYWDGHPGPMAWLDFARSRLGLMLMPSFQRRKYGLLPHLGLLKSSFMVESQILHHFKSVLRGEFPQWK